MQRLHPARLQEPRPFKTSPMLYLEINQSAQGRKHNCGRQDALFAHQLCKPISCLSGEYLSVWIIQEIVNEWKISVQIIFTYRIHFYAI
jgi:hypothetical protein